MIAQLVECLAPGSLDRERSGARLRLDGRFDRLIEKAQDFCPATAYAAYRAAWPLEPGYPQRRAIYNLYHLINHLNHFGSSYAGGVADVLRHFGG